MASLRTGTIISILQELGDDDFKQFKWHLSEYKHIPYFQLEHSDRVDTSIKIKKTYGAERGLLFIMDLLKEMNMNDVVSRFSSIVLPMTGEAVTSDGGGETPGRIAADWRPSPEAAIPEEKRASQLKMHSLMGAGLICAIFGSILLVVSTVTNNWLESYYDGSRWTNQGLWKACMYHNCTNINHFFSPDKAMPLQATGAFMILACIACFVGIIVGIKSFSPVSPFRRYKYPLAAASMFFFSSIVLLMVMGIYTVVTIGNLSDWSREYWFYSWSYKLGWAALIMILVTGFLYLWPYRMHERERNRRNRTQHGARNIFYIS